MPQVLHLCPCSKPKIHPELFMQSYFMCSQGAMKDYMGLLVNNFNAGAAEYLMCRWGTGARVGGTHGVPCGLMSVRHCSTRIMQLAHLVKDLRPY